MQYRKIESGKRFGRLTCEAVATEGGFGGATWKCTCECGSVTEVSEAMLISGVIRSCGCRNNRIINLQGQRFGMLTVLEPVPERAVDGSMNWLCRCDCGQYVTQSANKLRMGRSVSCGCQVCAAAQESKTYIDGTCVEIMLSERISKNNTSGIKGVARKRNKWQAYINYGRKRISLGSFETKELAAEARQAAEQRVREHLKRLLNETTDGTEAGITYGESGSV